MDVRHQVVLSGLGFPEGPVVLPDGRLAFVDLRTQQVNVWDGARASMLARLPGSPNGATLGSDGRIYVANNGGLAPLSLEELWVPDDALDGRIQAVALDGAWEDIAADNLPGPEPHRPNDLCFGPDGWLYFTDPTNWEVLPDERRYQAGRVCRTDGSGSIELVAEIAGFPNGIGFAPGGDELIVALTLRHRLVSLTRRADGSFGAPRPWCELPSSINPDGFCFDASGAIYVAGSVGDALVVVGPDRRVSAVIETGAGSDPTNVCLEPGRLWITFGLAGQLAWMPVDAEPLPLFAGHARPAG